MTSSGYSQTGTPFELSRPNILLNDVDKQPLSLEFTSLCTFEWKRVEEQPFEMYALSAEVIRGGVEVLRCGHSTS